MSEGYRTVAQEVAAELVEKRSRFIARIVPVTDEEEALAALAEIRRNEHGARHNPYAYRLHDGRTRYSDDGEPAQTAGRPMLDVLTHAELTDVIGIVTRYFGGVLLGTGGLVRAYGGALQLAVDAAEVVSIVRCVDVKLTVGYPVYEAVRRLIADNAENVAVLDTNYTDEVTFHLRIREGHEQPLLAAIADVLSANPDATVSAPYDAPLNGST